MALQTKKDKQTLEKEIVAVEKQPKQKPVLDVAVLNLDTFSIAQLPEYQGKKEEINTIIQDNPIVEIIDAETYNAMKNSRTAVRSLRTSLEKEQTEVKKKIKEKILNVVDSEYDILIIDVKTEEANRQDPITAYETKKEKERKEKEEAEEKRIATINQIITDYVAEWKVAFNLMIFDTIEEVGAGFLESYTNFDLTVLKEFEPLFPPKIEELEQYFQEKITLLTVAENARLEKIRLEEEAEKIAKQKAELAEKQRISDENEAKVKKEREDFEKEKAEFEAKQKADKEKSAYQLKVDNRIATLVDLGLKFDLQSTFVGFDFFIDVLDIKTYEDEKWDALIEKIEAKKLEPSPETVKGIEVEEKAVEAIQNTIPAEIVESTEVLTPEVPTVNICSREIATDETPKAVTEYPFTPAESFKLQTWEDIIEEFKISGEKSYSAWLKNNYNVPTKIQ